MYTGRGGCLMNEFGGEWTQKKLLALQKYLIAYRKIFDRNERAKFFNTIYIDGFAGSGEWASRSIEKTGESNLFENQDDFADASRYTEGSVQIALGLDSPFDKYIFIEQARSNANALEKLISEKFNTLQERTRVVVGDCNREITEITSNWNHSKDRAVCFLDPYGMSVNWETVESIAKTKAIDLWLLVPLGQGLCRLLMRREIPEGAWAERLDTLLGTADWRSAFYSRKEERTRFGSLFHDERCVGAEEIGEFFLDRLKSVFAGVAEKPLFLRNSKNSPLYMLCFAVGNENGEKIALRIANSIIGRT
jgi:three-Cys-motif partner protein